MNSKDNGFSFIEVMIAMVVLSVAFLGLATMVGRMQSLKLKSVRLQEAQYLSRKKLSDLSSVGYHYLASGSDPATNLIYGAPNQAVVTSGPLNKLGQTDSQGNQGPFVYTQSFVVCVDDSEGGVTVPGSGNACGNVVSSRPAELSCDVARTDEGQVEIRVITTYLDKDGQCHFAAQSSIVVDMEG